MRKRTALIVGIVWLSVAVGGCSLLPTLPDAPEPERHFDDIEPVEETATELRPLPDLLRDSGTLNSESDALPPAVRDWMRRNDLSGEYTLFSNDAVDQMLEFVEVAEGNQIIGDNLSAALVARKREINELVRLGQISEEKAVLLHRLLEREQWHRFFQSLSMDALVLALIVTGL